MITGVGPIYGVPLIKTLPLSGEMLQAMPSRADLESVAKKNMRVVAGYEVLLANRHEMLEALKKIVDYLGYSATPEANGFWASVAAVIRKAEGME